MTDGRVHIVGAGLAGLSAAVDLLGRGRAVTLYDAAPFAGGRCRTFHDARLGRDVDNGNHLVLTGNRAARTYMRAIGAEDRMVAAETAAFPFVDLAADRHWTVRLNPGPLPWWVLDPSRRIPDTRPWDYLAGAGLALAGRDKTVAQAVRSRGPLWTRFWEPLTLAALNTTPEEGAAPLLWQVLRETFARGAVHARPMFAPDGLGRALVDPATRHIEARGGEIHYRRALKAIETRDSRACGLSFADGDPVALGARDTLILALPPTRLGAILPDRDLPADDCGILNAHFTVPDIAVLQGKPPVTGTLSAKTHWVFIRGDVVSLTISAADKLGLMDADPEALIPVLWDETRRALGLGDLAYDKARINKERRATFDQSPAGVAKRPAAATSFTNVLLAGDATDTGLPATIEGAIRSGQTAAHLAVEVSS